MSCKGCPYLAVSLEDEWMCKLTPKGIIIENHNEIPYWCPLKNNEADVSVLKEEGREWMYLGKFHGIKIARGNEEVKVYMPFKHHPIVLLNGKRIYPDSRSRHKVYGVATYKQISGNREVKCYRKKPVIVKAIQWDGTLDGWYAVVGAFPELKNGFLSVDNNQVRLWKIRTLEGEFKVSPGDYIVQGINGEYYPVKPDIFKKTYEEVDCES